MAAWPDHEAEQAYRAQMWAEAFEAGRADMAREAGLFEEARAGAARADADPDADVRERVAAQAEADRAALEERRWGPGGRAHFGDPRPGDFPGRAGGTAAEPEPEQEAQAG